MAKLVLLNKPYGYLSQFTDNDGHPGLSTLCPIPGVYPAGRLDRDSEGLLLLTDDGRLQARICEPTRKMPKSYLVLVEGTPAESALEQLRKGVVLKDGLTAPATVALIETPRLWPRTPPVRIRKTIQDSWLRMTITEGRNRQVRRMTAAVGHPTLRLVRESIGDWSLQGTPSGQYRTEMIHMPKPLPRQKPRKELKQTNTKRPRRK